MYYCPKCTAKLIKTNSLIEDAFDIFTTKQSAQSTPPKVIAVWTCIKCSIQIEIDDGKKSEETKKLIDFVQEANTIRKRCEDNINAFNEKWGDSQTFEKLEALLLLK